ncbi:MAG: class I tRNA ligase family protein, partial [Prolixibacteraceae bacterium]|nr:class I tRNA ligase family protein [Prolixibacteraceae bacterium]
KPAAESVENDIIRFYPPKFKNVYRHWMENIKDWCISRQLWWGHQIPVYFLPDRTFVVAETKEKALALAREQSGNKSLTEKDLRQEEDVLDTWFSSWLWPISVFDGIRDPENKEINYYYPTNDLVTAPDIIFFWVARMIIAGYEYRGELPFKNVYFTGMVRDQLRRKMSKSLGNSPDPISLIKKYGADGVRVGMLLCSPAGGDLLYDDSLPQQGAGFATKIWNSFRLLKGWTVDNTIEQPEYCRVAIEWFQNKFSQILEQTNDNFDKYKISEALMSVYTTIRDEFSGWLLEIVKPEYQKPIDKKTYDQLVEIYDAQLRFIHPFMPFVTEEIWQLLKPRKNGESITISNWPESKPYDKKMLNQFEEVKETVSGIRTIRTQNSLSGNKELQLFVLKGEKGYSSAFDSVLKKLGILSSVETVEEKKENAASFLVKSTSFYIPVEKTMNVEEEKEKLEADLKYARGFLNTVMKKLSNRRFVNHAPEAIVNKEKTKKADAEAKIKVLEEQIANLK